MATTVTPSALTITIEENISLNGVDHGSKITQVIPDVTEISRRIIEVGLTEYEILAFGSAKSLAGTFDEDDVRYIRITNLDDTNFVTLTFKDSASQEFAVKLDYGQSFIYNGDLATGVATTMDADNAALTVSLADLVNITADADTAVCDLEVFVAGV